MNPREPMDLDGNLDANIETSLSEQTLGNYPFPAFLQHKATMKGIFGAFLRSQEFTHREETDSCSSYDRLHSQLGLKVDTGLREVVRKGFHATLSRLELDCFHNMTGRESLGLHPGQHLIPGLIEQLHGIDLDLQEAALFERGVESMEAFSERIGKIRRFINTQIGAVEPCDDPLENIAVPEGKVWRRGQNDIDEFEQRMIIEIMNNVLGFARHLRTKASKESQRVEVPENF